MASEIKSKSTVFFNSLSSHFAIGKHQSIILGCRYHVIMKTWDKIIICSLFVFKAIGLFIVFLLFMTLKFQQTGFGNASKSAQRHRALSLGHDGVIKWKHFSCHWSFVRGIHRSPVNSPHKSEWRGSLMFSLICAWIHGWVNSGDGGDLRRGRAHYDVTVMDTAGLTTCSVLSSALNIQVPVPYMHGTRKLVITVTADVLAPFGVRQLTDNWDKVPTFEFDMSPF